MRALRYSSDRASFRTVWRLTWPMVIYNVLEMTVGFVDFLMVRPFGPAATAAIGIDRQVTFLVQSAALAISTGAITLASQSIGARRQDRVNEVARQSICLVLLLAIPSTAAGVLLAGPLLHAMRASPATLAYGVPYLRVYFGGVSFLWLNLVVTAIFRGVGDVWTPLKLAVIVNLLNIAANYVFIFGLGPLPSFEVQGAAMGTVAARACGAAAGLAILLRGTPRVQLPLRGYAPGRRWWSLNLIGRMLRIGTPMALAGLLRNGSRLIFLAILGAGTRGMSFQAAVGLGLQVRLFSVLPALAFQIATGALVGQAIGRNDYETAEALGRRSVALVALIMTGVAGAIIALAGPLATLFIDSAETAQLAAIVLRWFAVAQFFSALSIVAQGALMGAGDTAPAMRYTFICQWLVLLPLAWLLMGWLPHGPLLAWAVAPLLSFLLTWRRLESGRWKTLRA
jgi:putative MATE family efflux protein